MSRAPRSARTDGEATRARILEAAGTLFAATGYAETTSKAVAARAEVDLASINYHFGNRGGLYQAVLGEAHRQIVDYSDLLQVADSDRSSEDKLRSLIELMVDRAMAEPESWYLSVLVRELLVPTSHLRRLFQDVGLPKIAIMRRVLAEITGFADDDPALTRCLISVMLPCLMLLVGGHRLPGPLHEMIRMPRDEVVDHLYRFALGGLRAVAQS